jgi:glycosyltransferase involved in cell wall biosynthesis
MTVGLVSPLPPQLGGVVTVARWLLSHEDNIGCRYVTFDLARPTNEAGGRLRTGTLVSQLVLLARFLNWARRSPRVVHCMVSPTFTGLSRDIFYLGILRLMGRRAVAHVHVVRPTVFWWRLMTRLGGKFATKTVVLGTAAQTALSELGLTSHTVPNAIPFPPFSITGAKYTGNRRTFRLLFVGTFGERKGCHELLEAMALLHEEGLDCRLDIAGREEYSGEEERLREEVEAYRLDDVVSFVGQHGTDELSSFYKNSDGFCLPSRLEGLPLALIEAMAYGLPAVATPVGCVDDLVIDGETGLLAQINDPKSLSEQLGRLIRDPELRRKLGQNGARHVAAHMGPDVIANAWCKIYASVAA